MITALLVWIISLIVCYKQEFVSCKFLCFSLSKTSLYSAELCVFNRPLLFSSWNLLHFPLTHPPTLTTVSLTLHHWFITEIWEGFQVYQMLKTHMWLMIRYKTAKNHVTDTRNTRMSHLAVLCLIMSHIYKNFTFCLLGSLNIMFRIWLFYRICKVLL